MRVQQLSHTLLGPPQVASVPGVTVRHFEGGTDIADWTDLMQSAFFAADDSLLSSIGVCCSDISGSFRTGS